MTDKNKVPPIIVKRPVDSRWPITAVFGQEGKHWRRGWHTGTDFATPQGVECVACADGLVQIAHNNDDGYGNRIWIVCDSVTTMFRANYAHLSRIYVPVGKHVKEGEVIGLTGNTGNSKGPHLHFEVRRLPKDEPTAVDFYDSRVSGFIDPLS